MGRWDGIVQSECATRRQREGRARVCFKRRVTAMGVVGSDRQTASASYVNASVVSVRCARACRDRWNLAPHHHERQRQRKRRCVCVVGVRHEVRRRAGAGRGCVLCKRGWMDERSTGAAINAAGMHPAQACRSALLPWSTPVCISSVDDKRIACISIQ